MEKEKCEIGIFDHWNYRVIKTEVGKNDFLYAIHEVYYDKNDKIVAWAAVSVTPTVDKMEDLDEIINKLERSLRKEILIGKDIIQQCF